jgi:hypothetical protein
VIFLIVPVDSSLVHQNQSKHTLDTDLKQLFLQRDRTKLICHNVVVLLFPKSNINFNILGDKSIRQPNIPDEE